MNSVPQRWSAVSQALHWLMAGLIFSQFALGWIAESWRLSPTKLSLMMWHKSMGLVLLALVLIRLAWRWLETIPAPPAGLTERERWLRSAAVFLLYCCMLAMPLSGWIISSAANIPFRMFGVIPVPDLVPPGKPLQQAAESAHLFLSWSFALLLALHVGNALYHRFIRKDNLLLRMLPSRFRGNYRGGGARE